MAMVKRTEKTPVDEMRQRLLDRLLELGIDQKQLSLEAGKNHSYINQFIYKGVPEKLPEEVRRKVSERTGLPESELGAPSFGAADDGRPYDAPPPRKHVSPVYHQDWSGELSPERFKRFVEPLIVDFFGEKALKKLNKDFYGNRVRDALKWLEECREDDPTTPVTNHLGIYLQSMLGAIGHAETGDFDLTIYADQAHQTAAILLRNQKSGRKAE